jgi:hypothetical protein
MLAVDILIKTLKQTAYYMLDEPDVIGLFKLSKSNLTAALEKSKKEEEVLLIDIAFFKQQMQVYMYLAPLLESHEKDVTFKIEMLNLLLA